MTDGGGRLLVSVGSRFVTELSPIQWAVRPLKKYADFKGRAPRAEYWWFYLATIIVGYVLGLTDKVAGDSDALSGIFSLVTLVPWLAVTVRRFHDTNRSGWWLLVLLLAIAMAVVFTIFAYGSLGGAPTSYSFAGGALLAVVILGAFITMLVFMVLPGTDGPNRYGADPYGPDHLEEIFA